MRFIRIAILQSYARRVGSQAKSHISTIVFPLSTLYRWEDGLLQLNVPKKYMRQVVAEDDASAGKGVPLTAEVVEHLTWIGKTVGPVLDEVRKVVHLTDLAKVRPTST